MWGGGPIAQSYPREGKLLSCILVLNVRCTHAKALVLNGEFVSILGAFLVTLTRDFSEEYQLRNSSYFQENNWC